MIIGLILLLSITARGAPNLPPKECVVLLHGLWRTEFSMIDLAWELEQAGYSVANVTYPSLTYPIETLAQKAVGEGLAECHEQGLSRIHFVTHSLGGILLRQYLSQNSIYGLGRVVMLGPPNQGSQLADYVNARPWLRRVSPPVVAQLGTGAASLPLQLGPVDFELGVIAGTENWRSGLPGIPKVPSDGTVAVEETRIEGMVDFIEMPVSHSFMMWNPDVQAQVIYFLRHGHFAVP